MRKPIIAITMGDPGGIGPEVIAKSFQHFKTSDGFYYLLIGVASAFEFLKEEYRLDLPLNPIPTLEFSFLREDAINFLDVSEEAEWLVKNIHVGAVRESSLQNMGGKANVGARRAVPLPIQLKGEFVFDIGKISQVNAAMAYASLKVAAYQAAAGLVDAIVTAPVNKTAIRLIDPKFHGHTEYLAKVSKTKKFAMMFVSNKLKVTLATIHVPLRKVSRMITEELVFEKISLTDSFLKTYFNIPKPKLAVCAVNPHGQETGEEDEITVMPAVRRARAEKIEAVGPLSADQLFHDAYEGHYDAVISMYHDQGLVPFKMISFRDGVNVTLGLPFVRTSPDHGTAFDIAYTGKADPSSMKAALALAEKLINV